jgi:CheY-like chemotaxis protein
MEMSFTGTLQRIHKPARSRVLLVFRVAGARTNESSSPEETAAGTTAALRAAGKGQLDMSVCNDVEVNDAGATAMTAAPDSIQVWLVDDSANLRELMAELLGDEGFACRHEFGSAEAVLKALEREPGPDVILLDVRMPGMGGLRAVRLIKSLAADTRVLMLTTFYDSCAKAQALQDGASALLLKSLSIAEISAAIRQSREECLGSDEVAVLGERTFNRPGRRAPGCGDGQYSDDDVMFAHPAQGHRNATWRSASGRLARGVHYVLSLLGLELPRRQRVES